jgi:hypothetical protein
MRRTFADFAWRRSEVQVPSGPLLQADHVGNVGSVVEELPREIGELLSPLKGALPIRQTDHFGQARRG